MEIHERSGFGVVEVTGLDPNDNNHPDERLRMALAQHAVLCLRMQRGLDDTQLQSVARRFGAIKDPVARTKGGGELRYTPIRQIIDSGRVVTTQERENSARRSFGGLDELRPALFETYHCDDTYTAQPAWATVLHARELPRTGGATCFIDMRDAYASLNENLRRQINNLRVVYAYNNEDAFPPRRAARGPNDVLEEVSHPLVRTHRLAGSRSIFIDLDRAKHVAGMAIVEGRKMLQSLQDHAETHASACEHHWRAHDVLVWDNASVQHKARSDFSIGEPRSFWRYMIAGETPV